MVRDPAANDPALCNGGTASPACAGQSHEQRLFYDQVGNRIRLEDPDGGISAWAYDGAGLVAQQWRGNGQSHTFTYDAFGRMQQIHPVNPPAPEADIVFTYGAATAPNPTARGRLIRADDDEGFELFGYDAAGNLADHTRTVGGKRFAFSHVSDPLGRRQQTTYPDGEVVTWHYDKALLARISSASGSYDGDYLSGAGYDALDRPTVLGAGGIPGNPVAFLGWEYDPVTGELDSTFAVRTSDFGTLANLDYTIDGIGRVTRLETTTLLAGTGNDPGLESRTFNYFYDGMRRLRTANGPLSGSATTTQILQYRYDPIDNLREIESVPVDHAHPEKPHWPSARNGLPIEADPEGAIASRTVGAAVQAFTHDSLGRPRQTGNLVHGYDWTSRRVRTQTTAASATILEPEPGYSYEDGRVNKHFFVAGRRVAASAKSWTAPSASAPVLWAPDWPRLPLPPPWAWGLGYAGALGGLLVLAGRRRGHGGASPGLRFASVAVLATVAPTLIVGCPPSGKRFGSFGEAALFFVTDAVGSTILAVRPDGSVRNRFLYRPYGQMIVSEGTGSNAGMKLAHGFAGGAVLAIGGGSAIYAFGPRLYDPSAGHFYQPDPLLGDPAAPQTMQPYGYALGNPLRLADPTGLFSEGGPVSSPPSFGVPSFPFGQGNGKGRIKPVNTASNVPPAPTMGFQESQSSPEFDAQGVDFAEAPFPPQERLQELLVGPLLQILRERTFGEELDDLRKRERRTRGAIERLDVMMFLPLLSPRALEPRKLAMRAVLTALTLRRRELLVNSLERTRSRINTLEHGAGLELTKFPPIPPSPLSP